MQMKRAEELLNGLDRSHLVELKNLSNPPEDVKVVVLGLCLVFGIKENWIEAKKYLLSDVRNLKTKMLNYDKDNMPHTITDKLAKYVNKIDIDRVTKTFMNLRVLAIWLQSLSEYSTFKKYCAENNIEFEMTYAEYPHGMFSANQYQSYLSNNLDSP